MARGTPEQRGAVDFSRSAVSRYIQLAMLFRRRIESGEWPLGEQIPTVDDLAAQYGVARATVRQALDALEADGLIERFRAKGTFVIEQPQRRLWHEIPTDWSGLLLSSPDTQVEILGVTNSTQPARVMHEIGTLAPSYRRWQRRHSKGGQRYYFGDAYVDTRVARRLPRNTGTKQTTLRALQNLDGLELTEVRQTVTIGAADVEVSEMLDVPLSAPVAYVYRTAVDAEGTIVFVGDGVYRGDVIRLDINVSL
jgi:GntR family transcriptional regulator